MEVPLLRGYTESEVLGEVQTSYSYRNTPRYQWERLPNGVHVRAAYGRKFERVYIYIYIYNYIYSCFLGV